LRRPRARRRRARRAGGAPPRPSPRRAALHLSSSEPPRVYRMARSAPRSVPPRAHLHTARGIPALRAGRRPRPDVPSVPHAAAQRVGAALEGSPDGVLGWHRLRSPRRRRRTGSRHTARGDRLGGGRGPPPLRSRLTPLSDPTRRRLMPTPAIRRARTDTLEIGYEDHGRSDAPVTMLLHGFPDDARAWDHAVPALASVGHHVIVPYLRGFGPTRFLDTRARTAQQAALGQDLLDLMNALSLDRVALVGQDW